MSAEEYGLEMPFICCVSNGGAYEDRSFVAGATMAAIATTLDLTHPEEHAAYVSPALVAQLDLVAMRHGYAMTSEPWDEHPDEWALVTFTRIGGAS